jgi:hypothetical protein
VALLKRQHFRRWTKVKLHAADRAPRRYACVRCYETRGTGLKSSCMPPIARRGGTLASSVNETRRNVAATLLVLSMRSGKRPRLRPVPSINRSAQLHFQRRNKSILVAGTIRECVRGGGGPKVA